MMIRTTSLVKITVVMYALVETVLVEAASLSTALKYLKRFGYIDESSTDGRSMAAQLHMGGFISAIKKFQRFNGLQDSGRLDAETVKKMKQPRCGNRDPVHQDPRSRAYILHGSKWPKLDLTYRIESYSKWLSRKAVDEIIGKAFSYWSKPSSLRFTQLESGTADIEIKFATGDHGDGLDTAFDGPGGVLGHAFFPRYGGSAHFDDAERWTQSGPTGINLLQVAVHEFGHTLGLDHSDHENSTMHFLFTDENKTIFRLHEDDIAGIQKLYPLPAGVTGATESSVIIEDTEVPPSAEITTPDTTQSPFPTQFHTTESSPWYPTRRRRFSTASTSTVSSNVQNSTVSPASVSSSSKHHTTPLYYEVNQSQELPDDDALPPRPSSSRFPSITTTSESLVDTSGTTLTTSSDMSHMTEFHGEPSATITQSTTSVEAPSPTRVTSPVTKPGMPIPYRDLCGENFTIDAVTTSDGIGYLFSGEYHWTINTVGEVSLPGQRISTEWGGIPGSLDAALTPTWANGRTYFLKGPWYWRVTDRKVDSGYPKLIRASWGGIPDFIDAAFQWGKNSRTYFVKGNQVWTFDRTKLPPVRGPRLLPVDRGFPQRIDAGFRSSNGRTYLFSKDQYYAMSTHGFHVSSYYPQPTAPRWFGCGWDQAADHLGNAPASSGDEPDVPNRPTTKVPMRELYYALFPFP